MMKAKTSLGENMDTKVRDFYEEALRLWGEDAQIRMCIEEMSELTKELCKFQRYTKIAGQATPEKIEEIKNNIIEEIADVLNCTSQMANIFGKDEVEKVRVEKVERTISKLEDFRKITEIKRTTLLYVVKDGKVLLGKKLRGFGEGKVNGAGGKVQENESLGEAMLRETKEEFGIIPKNYKQVGNILYDEFNGDKKLYFDTAIFVASDYEGEPKTSDEMMPIWYNKNNLPYEDMFGDDIYWLENILNGKRVNARFEFDKDFNIVSKNIYFS